MLQRSDISALQEGRLCVVESSRRQTARRTTVSTLSLALSLSLSLFLSLSLSPPNDLMCHLLLLQRWLLLTTVHARHHIWLHQNRAELIRLLKIFSDRPETVQKASSQRRRGRHDNYDARLKRNSSLNAVTQSVTQTHSKRRDSHSRQHRATYTRAAIGPELK